MHDLEPFVDIHCHLLPDIDDGAADWDESLAMARVARHDGISAIVATPHQLGSYGRNCGDVIRQRTRQLQELLDRQDVRLRVLPGADVRIEPDMIKMIRTGEVLTLGDHGRHVLLELPHEVYFSLHSLLDELQTAGLVGILSHPERNLGIIGRRNLLKPLVDAGCLLQVTAGSLVGTFGPQVREFTEWLIANGLVHFVATDAHSSKSRRPLMGRAFDRVVELAGEEMALELCCRNPMRIVMNEDVLTGRLRPRSPGLTGWLRWLRAG